MNKIIVGPQIGEIVKDGKKIREEHIVWCARHDLTVKDPKHPTQEEKEKFEKATMKDYLLLDKDGLETRGKICPRCHQTVVVYKETKKETN